MLVSSPSALSAAVVLAAAAASLTSPVLSFVVPPSPSISISIKANNACATCDNGTPSSKVAQHAAANRPPAAHATSALFMSSNPADQQAATTTLLSLALEKPLGLILEEADDGTGGVVVTAVNEGGSAFDIPEKEQLIGSKIGSVMGLDVSASSFDDVMGAIIEAPSPLDIEFAAVAKSSEAVEATAEGEEEAAPPAPAPSPSYEVGSTVTITVQQPENGRPDIVLDARVGDNLRKTLLENKDIELYRGLKKKLGNCGGGGQCGFCAVELVDDGEGVWGVRSDYEAQRIGKNGSGECRLACMNNIVGPATVRTL